MLPAFPPYGRFYSANWREASAGPAAFLSALFLRGLDHHAVLSRRLGPCTRRSARISRRRSGIPAWRRRDSVTEERRGRGRPRPGSGARTRPGGRGGRGGDRTRTTPGARGRNPGGGRAARRGRPSAISSAVWMAWATGTRHPGKRTSDRRGTSRATAPMRIQRQAGDHDVRVRRSALGSTGSSPSEDPRRARPRTGCRCRCR